ncbi:hypothetical protein [Ensifer adhaerens]|nr:hypothetical protein [Ensifer adhaerens]
MSLPDTPRNLGSVVHGWNARYDLEEFIKAYHLPPRTHPSRAALRM